MDTKESLTEELVEAANVLKAAVKWWKEEAQHLTTGDHGEHNVFDEDPAWVVNALGIVDGPMKTDCEYFEILDWDENTSKIYNAMCTCHSPHWKDGTCGDNCEHKVFSAGGKVYLTTEGANLTQGDIDILSGSMSRLVRCNASEDARVKELYKIWKIL